MILRTLKSFAAATLAAVASIVILTVGVTAWMRVRVMMLAHRSGLGAATLDISIRTVAVVFSVTFVACFLLAFRRFGAHRSA